MIGPDSKLVWEDRKSTTNQVEKCMFDCFSEPGLSTDGRGESVLLSGLNIYRDIHGISNKVKRNK